MRQYGRWHRAPKTGSGPPVRLCTVDIGGSHSKTHICCALVQILIFLLALILAPNHLYDHYGLGESGCCYCYLFGVFKSNADSLLFSLLGAGSYEAYYFWRPRGVDAVAFGSSLVALAGRRTKSEHVNNEKTQSKRPLQGPKDHGIFQIKLRGRGTSAAPRSIGLPRSTLDLKKSRQERPAKSSQCLSA
jgi:hypothetical protein